jgi:hypothetical protein
MTTESLARPSHGVVLILAAAASVGAWAAHVFAVAGLARLDQTHAHVEWVMNALTVLLVIPCLVAIQLGVVAVRRARAAEGEGSPLGRTTFLGWMAIAVGGFNLLLIVLEEIFVIAIGPHG